MAVQERRASPREPIAVPVLLGDGRSATTLDISASGMFIEAPAGAVADDWMCIEYEMPDAGLRFEAAGELVRVVPRARTLGLAIRLHSPRLLPLR